MTASRIVMPTFNESEIRPFLESNYGLDVDSLKNLGSYFDQNFLVTSHSGERFILKIHDAGERWQTLEMQNEVASLVNEKLPGIAFPCAVKSLQGKTIESIQAEETGEHLVRLLTFVPGQLLGDSGVASLDMLEQVGCILGRMDAALQDFDHPAACRPDMPWDLQNTPKVHSLLRYIENLEVRRIVDYFLLQFDVEVAPVLHTLRSSVTHHDGHRNSILTDDSGHHVTGVIDFGDTVHTATIFNLAVAASDALLNREDRIEAITSLVRGYHAEFAIEEQEVALLYWLVAARLCIYAAISSECRVNEPNNAHAQAKREAIFEALKAWVATNPAKVEDQLRSSCGFTSNLPGASELKAACENRAHLFPDSLYTHYEEPLYLNRGSLQYLHDARGDTYLDCVNNVCQWGHCHPVIVRALQRQAARLNTNSRYIYDVMTEYAERLTATMPDPLSVCFLVNSGSEANDLALRLARCYTGNRDVIVVDKAYHGNSDRCTEISPNRIDRPGKPGLPEHVHKAILPNTFSGPYRGADAGVLYAADVERLLQDLAGKDRAPSAFIAESLVGTGGQYVLPHGYLEHVYSYVRASGGLCIADEVQMGFGRIGSSMWCFESQGVVPDIVTMGKPIANGHPMAAVVTTPEIAAAFNNGVTYFNTFGGNPVSCATALAVLDVLDTESLQDNVVQRSEQLFAGLQKLKAKFSCIADVRGQGLYIGVELVLDSETLEPATALAQQVVEGMKMRGVLVNTNGYENNIIKIKPPLIIGEQDIDRLVSVLEDTLTEFV